MPPPPQRSSVSSQPFPTAPGESSPQETSERRRVIRACDRCRLKKIKCDGVLPCSRCSTENSICRFGERKPTTERRIPPGYVEYLEEQQQLLVQALKRSYARSEPGASEDTPVHTILESLGVFADSPLRQQRESTFHFEEDLEVLRNQCEAEAIAASSASTTATSQVVSAQQTPSRLSPEPTSAGFPFPQRQTYSPASFQQLQPLDPSQRQQAMQSFSSAPQLYIPPNASAPSSVFDNSISDIFAPPNWGQPPLMPVQSDPTTGAPMHYWPSHEPSHAWQSDQSQTEQQHGTIDPSRIMSTTTSEAYLQTAEAWEEYIREQQRRQR